MNDHQDAWLKLFWTWLFVGISQMSPLQFVQFVAACIAIIYTVAQLYVLVRDKIVHEREPGDV